MIRLDGVSLAFGDLEILAGVDLEVEAGEFVGLVGPNGAGKTTLLRTINGLLEPDSGEVVLDGRRVADLPSKAVSRTLATVPQDTHVGFAFRAEQLVEMGRTPHRSRFDWTDDAGPVERAMERTETVHLRDRTVDDLSGGERQRVLLARALAQEPRALLLDEPTASLDINHQIRVLGLVEELVGEGRAAIAAIHDLDLAARFCDRLLLLHDGEIATRGSPQAVLEDPRLGEAFGTATAITKNPVTGTPKAVAIGDRPDRDARVHVAGGADEAAVVARRLWQAGFSVSVGPVPAGSVVAELADHLGLDHVTSAPFQPPGPEDRTGAVRLANRADTVVVTGGPGSEIVEEGVGSSVPTVRTTEEPQTLPAARLDGGGDGGAIPSGDESTTTGDTKALVDAVEAALEG